MSDSAPQDHAGAERVLWAARPNMRRLWGLALVILAVTAVPAWAFLSRLFGCTAPCITDPAHPLMGALAMIFALAAALLLVMIPLGGLKFDYRLTDRRFRLRRILLGREKRTELAMPGHRFSQGRGWTISAYPAEPGTGGKAMLICLSRRDTDALRDALPEGAWG